MSMEASDTVRRNEAIARFMGWRKDEVGWYLFDLNPDGVIMGDYYLESAPEFDTDWGLLMPCAEKILKANPDSLDYMLQVIFVTASNKFGCCVKGHYGQGDTAIESVFLAVSEHCLSLEPKS